MSTRITGDDWGAVIHGAPELVSDGAGGVIPHRVPTWGRAQIDDALFTFAEGCPVGVAVCFDTAAARVRLTLATSLQARVGEEVVAPVVVVRRGGIETAHACPPPTVVRLDGDDVVVATEQHPSGTIDLEVPGEGPVRVFLPHNAHVTLVALEADAAITPVEAAPMRWTHYGSSISQGMNAVTAIRTWPVATALRLGWSLTNLSLSGNAQLDGFAARVIRDTPADLITLKVGINLLNADSMRERAFRPAAHAFLDTIREGQPDTPIVVISAVSCPIHEHAPGPVLCGPDGMMYAARRSLESDAGALTLARTREILAEVVAGRGDERLTYLDGRRLFGPDDTAMLYDLLHPDQDGLDLIATRFVEEFRGFDR